ncbi:MAG: hypothetical protein M1828_002210 [Chrysothrix sp. TS-e1954]|nr:MAG: hypothetical protein M1828_002210 [Chrysothrix sp. TS-e1954]
MSSVQARRGQEQLEPLRTTRSFSRFDPEQPKKGAASSTLSRVTRVSNGSRASEAESDLFERKNEAELSEEEEVASPELGEEDFDGLPVEIKSLIERFLESIALKSRPAPLSIEQLSELFQNFYVHVEQQIDVHISTLSTKISRDNSPAPSVSSRSSKDSRQTGRAEDGPTDQQMLTASEVLNKRKARRHLEFSRIHLEEAVEKVICERAYSQLWRHGGTDDEARDEVVRSRAAALSVVGVDLSELLSTALDTEIAPGQQLPHAAREMNNPARQQLSDARESLERMNDTKYPLGKLRHLVAAHKNIVEGLSVMLGASSSADEVLPTMIYLIISSKPQTLSVASNFNFIQNFRAAHKVNGEAAYCLVNLEAAISFMETVDLSSIRPSETPQGPPKSATGTPGASGPDPMYRGFTAGSPEKKEQNMELKTPSTPKSARRISQILAARPARPKSLDAASDVFKDGAETIHAALDGSFKVLFGRLRERKATNSPTVDAPKTLDDAMKIINSPTTPSEKAALDDAIDDQVSEAGKDEPSRKHLQVVNSEPRDRSVDSAASSSSQKRVAFIEKTGENPLALKPSLDGVPNAASSPAYGAVESMRNLSNTLNPLKGFSMRGFGRSPSVSSSQPIINTVAANPMEDANTNEKAAIFDVSGVAPAMPRFVEMKESKELNGYDVELLLRDYQRLAGALRALQSS